MSFFFGAASVVSLVTFLLISYHFTRELLASDFKRRDAPLIIVGVTHLVFAVLLLFWSTGSFEFVVSDFIILLSAVVLSQTFALTMVVYRSIGSRKVFSPFFSYLLLIPLVYLEPVNIHMVIPFSFLVVLLSFTLYSNLHKKINQTPIVYSAVSLVGYLFAVVWPQLISFVTFISGLAFLSFIHFFMRQLRSNPEDISELLVRRNTFVELGKHFAFLLIITNFIFIGVVGVHEAGHIVSAKVAGCQDAKIVLGLEGLPHSETTCQNNVSPIGLLLGGIIAPFVAALFLYFSGGVLVREFSLQIFAINLMISYQDLLALGLSLPIATSVRVLGAVIGILSLGLLAKSKVL